MEIKERHLKIKCFSIGCPTYLSDAFIKSTLDNDYSLLHQYTELFPRNYVIVVPGMNQNSNNAHHGTRYCCNCCYNEKGEYDEAGFF